MVHSCPIRLGTKESVRWIFGDLVCNGMRFVTQNNLQQIFGRGHCASKKGVEPEIFSFLPIPMQAITCTIILLVISNLSASYALSQIPWESYPAFPSESSPALVDNQPGQPGSYQPIDLPPPPGDSARDTATGDTATGDKAPSTKPEATGGTAIGGTAQLNSPNPAGTQQNQGAQSYSGGAQQRASSPPRTGSRAGPALPNANQILPVPPKPPALQRGQPESDSQSSRGLPPIPELDNFAGEDREGAEGPGLQGSLIGFQSNVMQRDLGTPAAFSPGKLVAIVGTERILAGDMAPVIEPIIYENKSRMRGKEHEEEVRTMLVRQILPQFVEMKAMQQEFFRDMAGNVSPGELKKMQEQVMTRVSKMFYDRYVPMELYSRYEVEDLAQLESRLQETGLSLSILKNHFLVQVMAAQLEEKYVPFTYEIPPEEILAYYRENYQRWQIPARVRWRQLTVRFDQHSSRREAEERIRRMGNEVALGGKPFEAVARDSSDGFTASEGGLHDWTFQGSLKSQELDEAIFRLPPNRLSDLIEDEIGLHIVEVLDREDSRTKEMAEIQEEIRETLSEIKRKQKAEEFREKVLSRMIVWTLWPDDIPGSRSLQEALAEPST